MAFPFPPKGPQRGHSINTPRVAEILFTFAEMQRVMGWSQHDVYVAFYTMLIALEEKMTPAEKKLINASKAKLDDAARMLNLSVAKPKSIPNADRSEGAGIFAAALNSTPLTDEEKGDDPLASGKK